MPPVLSVSPHSPRMISREKKTASGLTYTVKLHTSLGFWQNSPCSSTAEYATEFFSKESVRSRIYEGVDGTADKNEESVN